ncbi:hypothetical protein TcWFU_010534 [Taenia crassiceps]|uniref:Uncharacterized protein n=1 Tax=Taenia crassiceps TaxID=6207 RepID=A0ABR4Q299_9CEST
MTSAIYAILLVFAIAQSQAFLTLLDDEFFLDQKHPSTELPEQGVEKPVDTETAAMDSVGITQQDILLLRHDITLMRREIIIALERLRRTLERQLNPGVYWPFNLRYPGELSERLPYNPSSKQ